MAAALGRQRYAEPGTGIDTGPGAGLDGELFGRRRLVVVPGDGPTAPVAAAPTRPAERRLPRSVYWRRRAVVALSVLTLASGISLLANGGSGADADPVRAVSAGTETIEPGETLWDVAVTHAPDGVDPRGYLARLRELNGFGDADVPVWTVVLLPPR